VALAAVAAGAVVGLSACSASSGEDLARQACVHVERSVRAWEQSTRAGMTAAEAAQLQTRAASELRSALPLAAAANSDDGSWNSLMTTISEGATVDESHLVPSLKAQCVVANAAQNVNPQSPGNPRPPNTQNVNPRSPGG
jgi:hypothetical protein